jgi:DNA-binding LytR/AlgR family response regulator
MRGPEAIIADDEAPLRAYLRSKLSDLWPELTISGEAANGLEALALIEKLRPAIAFLDIKMPGLSGMEVAGKISGRCRVVFITAYDEYAIEAFEKEAIDYILKPVTSERLSKTVKRIRKHLASAAEPPGNFTAAMERLTAAINNKKTSGCLKWIKVRQGEEVRLISMEEICYFKAEDKYTLVRTLENEYLIKKSIQQLDAELEPDQFWRIHRGSIINVNRIAGVHRSFAGRLIVKLKDLPETLTVSRSYAHLFKQM